MFPRTCTAHLGWAVALAAALIACPAPGADRSLEYAVKATFLYKFASFVEWPPGTFETETAPLELCVVGADPFGGRIEQAIRAQSVGRHRIHLRRLDRAQPQSGCQVMFVSGSRAQTIAAALEAVAGTPTLTVTDSAIDGTPGIVHFVLLEDRVSFDIDNAAAAENHLVISSKLLALARRVNGRRVDTR